MPAMPKGLVVTEIGDVYGNEDSELGLTKLEHFSGLAMQGLLANPSGVIQSNSQAGFAWCNCDEDGMAQLAITCANALLKALDDGESK